MTTRFLDGFDYLPALTADVSLWLDAGGWWARQDNAIFSNGTIPIQSLTWSAYAGRFGFGNSVGMVNQYQPVPGAPLSQPAIINRPLGASYAAGWFGAGVYFPTGNTSFLAMGFLDAVNDLRQVTVTFHVNGVVKVWRGVSTPDWTGDQALLGTSAAGCFDPDRWFHCEVYCAISDTVGEVEVRLNQKPVIHLINQDTRATGAAASFDSIVLGAEGYHGTADPGYGGPFSTNRPAAIAFQFDDVKFNDGAGAVNNTWMGNSRVATQVLAGPSATVFSKVGAASNWQAASNAALDDSSYVYSNTVGARDLYSVVASLGAAPVAAVQLRGSYRMDDSTQRVVRNTLRSAGSDAFGADDYINQSYTYYLDVVELNPATGLGWTGTQVNALLVGPQIVS